MKARYDGSEEESDQRDQEHEAQIGQSPLHPMGLNPPRPAQYLVEVENPQPRGDAEQNYVGNVIDAVQNDAIIHDDRLG